MDEDMDIDFDELEYLFDNEAPEVQDESEDLRDGNEDYFHFGPDE